jgi:hypothetical protein
VEATGDVDESMENISSVYKTLLDAASGSMPPDTLFEIDPLDEENRLQFIVRPLSPWITNHLAEKGRSWGHRETYLLFKIIFDVLKLRPVLRALFERHVHSFRGFGGTSR